MLYRKELRSALRERSIVLNSVLIPIFLYPVMLWLLFTGVTFAEGLAEGTRSRVAVHGLAEEHREVLDSLAARSAIEVLASDSVAGSEARLAAGELDAVVVFESVSDTTGLLPGNFTVRIAYDRSLERSRRARERVADVIERHRERWLEQRARGMSIPRDEVEGWRVTEKNEATGAQLGTRLLAQTLPLFLVVMVALGCFIPAVDTTAGERERSTWETTLTVAAPRLAVVTAKYLHVATLGAAAGVLNVLAMFLSMGPVLRPVLARSGEDFQFALPPLALPVMVVGALALALFFAAAMMILAAFARTFKEGQGMVTPVYWLALVPLGLTQRSGVTLTAKTAAIPVANVAMMIRDAVRGIFLWPYVVETLAVELATVVLCLLLARSVLGFEDFLLGAYDGSFWRFLNERLLSRPRGARP